MGEVTLMLSNAPPLRGQTFGNLHCSVNALLSTLKNEVGEQ